MAAAMASAISCAAATPAVAAQLQAKGCATTPARAVCVRVSKAFSGLHSIDLPTASVSASSSNARTDGAVKSSRVENRRNPALDVVASAGEKKNILMLGGTRFIGLFLARLLVKEGHQVTLFTRGKAAVTSQLPGETDEEYAAYSSQVKHIKGDRQDFESLKAAFGDKGFNVVYDINGREGTEAEAILNAIPALDQYIFCSSAGVYLKSDLLPHREIDAGDPKSRHKGKLDTEALLESKGVKWTSIRPVYIYGPLNYNPVEEWFFHRLKAGRPIPIPSSGLQITQLGHVKDLATAFVAVLGNEKAIGQVYNISGSRYVTFDGIARACAKAGGFPEPELIHYNPKDFDFGKKKAFPLRDQHFFTSIEKAQVELGWTPEFGLVEGLTDSYNLDFGKGTFRKAADFSTDDMILEKLGKKTFVAA
ncbi:hypothetical protein MPTK1_1g11680 [Marchantia polymorpha subsp. ruderalis]|uniref:NAD-dependent epimerase/dehydratase domain-containing protein n=2 Tax=Marchantia polymorpha TaxID=3197 RepID=A0A176WJZ0_MARPO|nr:hypothetical protein AXG93_3822s1230 [Marchantia polymorpha subsp. ruderalis]PTQ45516.1 hypothetical protein MARPO_0014s0058 [Marchantia polymorpha]BBM98204.1 hypothetical protein Mp_1g11680 [Marchantia polymorpha subsp. ruderalis]|eukprot:PTQ45516.1 hypothetical protein MARPO_0014s0058 [Marchantia polymorpha]